MKDLNFRKNLQPETSADAASHRDGPEPMEMVIDGLLDLHTFRPGEAKDLVRDYVALCRERGILSLRIVHGKGTGQLRRTVHAVLATIEEVETFRLADEREGGWGATRVTLKP